MMPHPLCRLNKYSLISTNSTHSHIMLKGTPTPNNINSSSNPIICTPKVGRHHLHRRGSHLSIPADRPQLPPVLHTTPQH